MRYLITLTLICSMGCAAAKDALTIVGPIAAKRLTELIRARFDAEPNESTAGCVTLSDDPEVAKVEAETGEVYILCFAEPE